MTDPQSRLDELQALIDARNNELRARIDSFLQETGEATLPALQELSEEKAQLTQDIQLNKDEAEASLAQLNEDTEASAMFRVAARIQRFEDFSNRAMDYVQSELPLEVERVADADRRQSDVEVNSVVKELQAKREEELRKIEVLQERTTKRAMEMRNGPRTEHGEMGSHVRVSKPKPEEMDKETKDTKGFTEEAKNKKEGLFTKVKSLRTEKSKLQAELLDAKRRNDKIVNELKARIRQAELANTRDIRLCEQLNTGNAALTTNAQILLGQLNVDHYGISGAPEEKALLTMLKEVPKRTEYALMNGNNGPSQTEQNINGDASDAWRELCESKEVNETPGGLQSAELSRQQSGMRQSVASLKHASSQRNRDSFACADLDKSRESAHSAAHSVSAAEESAPRESAAQEEGLKNQ